MSETKVPKEGEFDQGRLWFLRRGNVLTIGLTNRAIDSLGDLEAITSPEEGDRFDTNDEVLTVEGTRGTVELVLPTKGLVIEVNPMVSDLNAITEDPLDEGWLIRYQVEDIEALLEL